MCVCCAPERETVNECVFLSSKLWDFLCTLTVYVFMCMHHIYSTVCVSHGAVSVCAVVGQKTVCSILENVKPTKNINHNSDTDPTQGFLKLYFCTIFVFAQNCRAHRLLWVYKSQSVIVYWIISAEIIWNSHYHKTLILFRNNIVKDVLSLLTQHIVILRHECNVAHSACGNLFGSIANENNPAAWCVV